MISSPVDRRSIGSQLAHGLCVWPVPAASVSRCLIRGCSLIADRCADRLIRVFRACQRGLGVFVEDLPARRICESLNGDLGQFIEKKPWGDKMTHVNRLVSKATQLQSRIPMLSPDMRSAVDSHLQRVLRIFSLELSTYVKILEGQVKDQGSLVPLPGQIGSSLLASMVSKLSQLQDSIATLLAIAAEEGSLARSVLERYQHVRIRLSQQHPETLVELSSDHEL